MVQIYDRKFSREDIQFIYDLYIKNVLKFAEFYPIKEIGIFDKELNDLTIYDDNKYLKGDWEMPLAESLIKNGTYFIYITTEPKFMSGNHRILALRKAAAKGLIPPTYKVLTMDISNKEIPPTKLIILKEGSLFGLCKRGLVTQEVVVTGWATHYICVILSELFFEYKKETGTEFPTSPIMNSKETFDNEKNKEH